MPPLEISTTLGLCPAHWGKNPARKQDRFHVRTPFFGFSEITSLQKGKLYEIRD